MRLAFRSVLAAGFLTITGAEVVGLFEEGLAAYERHDYAIALQVWRPLADHGAASAQNKLGNMYANGEGDAVPPVPGLQRRA